MSQNNADQPARPLVDDLLQGLTHLLPGVLGHVLGFLLQEFEGEPERIWQSNIFGRSFHELINEDLASKLKHMPEDAREKMRQTLEKIINEGSGGLICIIL